MSTRCVYHRPQSDVRASASRSSPSAAMAAARWRRARTSISSSCCPTKQTAWGESVTECDALRAVGPRPEGRPRHAARSTTASAWRASDMTIRTALLEARPILGDLALAHELVSALRPRAGAVDRAPSSSPPSSPSATSASSRPATRATWSSPTSRKARAACATSTRCSGSPNMSTACTMPPRWSMSGCSRRREYRLFVRGRGFPVGDALPPAFPDRPRRGPADLRPAARDRRASGLCRPRRAARRRALHEALFPRRQGRRRPDAHLLRGAGGAPAEAARHARPLRRAASAARQRKACNGTRISSSRPAASTSPTTTSSQRDPVNLIRLFHLADQHGLALHPDAPCASSPSRFG